MQGRIMKGIAGFYFVKSGETVYRCKARGLFKQQGIKPAVGDLVTIEVPETDDDSLITEILPRKNCFIRPFVSNVDCFAVVAAAAKPAPVLPVIDKLLVMAEQAETEVILCISKCDLADAPKKTGRAAGETMERILRIYSPLYPVVQIDPRSEDGIESLKELIRGKTTALAGASGVGKSTILNRLFAREHMETGEVSKKTERGRHTTRHAELFETEDGIRIFDTPGFTSFDLPPIDAQELDHLFPEMRQALGECRFDNCAHLAEPDCAVKAALEAGRIEISRYESYRQMYQEAEERNRR